MGTNKYFKIDVKIRDYFLSNNTAIVFTRLVYWFNKKPNGFYKFKQACKKHPLYKKGDSWGEELGMSRKVLDPILAKLVNHHKTKKAYNQSEDKFNGKIFASYTNHKTSQTFYFIDRNALDKFFEKIAGSKPPSLLEDATPSSAPLSAPENPSCDVPEEHHLACAHLDPSCIQTITSLDEEKLVSKKMVELWNSHMNDKVFWYPSYVERLCSVLKQFFNNCLETFKRYCLTVASADFLTGKSQNSRFKAFFFWAIKPKTIYDIIGGAYGVKNFFTLPSSEERTLKREIQSLRQQINDIDHRAVRHTEEIREGQKKLIKELKASLTISELTSLRKESDEDFHQRNPNMITGRYSRMLLDVHFDGRDAFLEQKLKALLGLEENIVIPQELIVKKSLIQHELQSCTDRLNEILAFKNKLKENMALEAY